MRQKPTPQLKVFNISSSLTPLFFIQLNILVVFIFFKSNCAQNFSGIIRLILSESPPPVILAHPFNSFLSIKFNISLT